MDETVNAYMELSSSNISDAMDLIGLDGTIDGISTQVPGKKMCGPAFTARYSVANSTLSRFADFLDDIPEGAVVAIDNNGRKDSSVWGDTLSLFAQLHKFAGTVIDGVCRDIEGTRSLDYPMFSRGTFMRTGKNRIGVESTQEPVRLGAITVHPGDLIFGDDTGVVAVPKQHIAAVLELSRKIVARDAAFVEAVKNGASILEVWQTKPGP